MKNKLYEILGKYYYEMWKTNFFNPDFKQAEEKFHLIRDCIDEIIKELDNDVKL